MTDITTIINYFKTLKRIIDTEAVLTFFSYKLVKKERINDIMCCIYATLPSSYSKLLKTKVNLTNYKSIVAFGMLIKLVTKTFKLDKKLSIVDFNKTRKTLDTIISHIEKDIEDIEKDMPEEL